MSREKVGQFSRSGIIIRHLRELPKVVERERVEIAVIAVPASAAVAFRKDRRVSSNGVIMDIGLPVRRVDDN